MYLCNPKFKILVKENMKTPKFADNEKIKLNFDFSSNNMRINLIPLVGK